MAEFDWIARHFAPLSLQHPAADAMRDDAATLPPVPKGRQRVVSTDSLVEGVHFLPDTAPEIIARRLFRTSLSDLAAMAATPEGCLLNLSLPPACATDAWLANFANGLRQDVDAFACPLWGGDTTCTPGVLTLSLTVFGHVAQPVRRSGAKVGDVVVVSGVVGDALAGLHAAQGVHWPLLSAEERRYVLQRYHLPEPRIHWAQAIAPYAHAMMDVTDGLAADVEKLCAASGVGAMLQLSQVPFSSPIHRLLNGGHYRPEQLIAAGDDYELLVTLLPEQWQVFQQKSPQVACHFTPIGLMTEERTVRWMDEIGQPVPLLRSGYVHGA